MQIKFHLLGVTETKSATFFFYESIMINDRTKQHIVVANCTWHQGIGIIYVLTMGLESVIFF